MVIDDEDRENEGDLIFAAELATPELVAFMVRYTSGYICVPITEAEADRLDLPPMYRVNQDRRGTAYTVTVDAREGVDDRDLRGRPRAHDPAARRPRGDAGRLLPPGARGAAAGQGRRACCAGRATPRPRSTWPCWPACGRRACCARSSARRTRRAWPAADELRVFADEHDLALISIADLIAYRRRFEQAGRARRRRPRVPLRYGEFTAVGYASSYDDREHVAFVFGEHRRRRGRARAGALRVPDR